ncbi:MAG: hypothetical protein Q7U14_10255, partial [Lacisediminimonas sp.]|nr:hypothetical protein [Lacisediminimonas sp.]
QTLQLISASGTPLTLAQDSLATIEVDAGEQLVGGGTLAGPVVNAGIVAPGQDAGLISVAAYAQGSGGVLQMEIGGAAGASQSAPSDNTYDKLAVSGTATLDGTLDLTQINDFRPSAGQVFDIITWGQRSGAFTSYKGLYTGQGVFLKPVYLADRLQLVATQLPGILDLNIPDSAQALAQLDQLFTLLADPNGSGSVSLDASLDLAGLHLTGGFDIAVSHAGGTSAMTFGLRDVAASWSAGDLSGQLIGVSGSIAVTGSQLAVSISGSGQVAAGASAALSGDFSIANDTVSGLLLVSGANLSARLGDPASGASLAMAGGTLAMALGQGGYAVQASGTGSLQGVAGSSFSGTLGFQANTLGQAIAMSFGGASAGSLNFASAERIIRFQAIGAELDVAGLGELRGDFAFDYRSAVTGTVREAQLLVGVRNLAADLVAGELSLQVSAGEAALVLSTRTPLAGGLAQFSTALQARADLSITVDSALTLTGQQVSLRLNRGNDAVSASVQTTGGAIALELAADAFRIEGRFAAAINGVMSFAGEMSVEANRGIRNLSDGRSADVREIAVMGSGVKANLTAGGSGLDAGIAGADFALVYAKEVSGLRSWVSAKVDADSLVVGGQEFASLDAATLSLNRAVSASDGTTLSWAQSRLFNLANGKTLAMDQLSDTLDLAADGA